MSYLCLQFDTDSTDAEAWADALLRVGALAVDVSDPRAGTAEGIALYGEPGEPGVELWPVSRLAAMFPSDLDAVGALADAAETLGRAVPKCEARHIADRDWVRATQAQFEPIRIDDELWVVPTWCEPPDPSALNLRLDPGVAFGTGSHPTTRLCLQWLSSAVEPGHSLLDYGCGSGILSIAAAKLGARPVVGTDIDLQALDASANNARANAAHATFVSPEALPDDAFDIVIANILANPLALLAPALARRVGVGGRIALCGILDDQVEAVAAAYSPWFNIGALRRADGWVLLAGDRRAD